MNALAANPPLLQFRGRFIGTRDMAACFKTTGSRMDISRIYREWVGELEEEKQKPNRPRPRAHRAGIRAWQAAPNKSRRANMARRSLRRANNASGAVRAKAPWR